MGYFAKFTDIADALSAERAEISGYTAIFEVHDAREWLVKKRADRGDGEASGFGLTSVSI